MVSAQTKKLLPAAIALGLFIAGSLLRVSNTHAYDSGATTPEKQSISVVLILLISLFCLVVAWVMHNKQKTTLSVPKSVTKKSSQSVKTSQKSKGRSKKK